MSVAEVNVGRVRRRRGSLLVDGSGDFSRWKLLHTANIQATTDTGGLETSKSMSGREIQFRGSVPSGNTNFHPDNGCLYRFKMINPGTGKVFSAGNGRIIGIQYYLKLGSTVPDAVREFVYCGIWDGTNGSFGGAIYLGGADRIANGSYTAVTTTTYTRSTGNAYLIDIMMADDGADSSGVAGLPVVKVFDDAGTPARVGSFASTAQTAAISATTARPTLSFSGDIDATIYYRLVLAPSSPF
tara:strand:- start:559 stop:1284 length:726 start_codon:yes stop_codon:yes gene_type:complete